MDASEGLVHHWSSGVALFEKTLSKLETFIQYYYLLGMIYIVCEVGGGIEDVIVNFRLRVWDVY